MQNFLHIPGLDAFLASYGYLGLFAVVFFESMGLPLPGETSIILAGGISGTGSLNPFILWGVAASAAVLGDNVAYLIGRRGGRLLVTHHGTRFGITHERLEKAENLMHRRGFLIVMLARFFPLLRQLNGIAAGTTGMHWSRFFIANVIGATTWTALWTFLGNRIGSDKAIVYWIVHHAGLAAVIVLPLVALAAFFALRKDRKTSS